MDTTTTLALSRWLPPKIAAVEAVTPRSGSFSCIPSLPVRSVCVRAFLLYALGVVPKNGSRGLFLSEKNECSSHFVAAPNSMRNHGVTILFSLFNRVICVIQLCLCRSPSADMHLPWELASFFLLENH